MKVKSESEVAQSCPTLRDPMDCSLPGSSIHGIFQARVLEWVAIAFSTMQETWVQFLGWDDPLETEKATHSSILAWESTGTLEPGGLQSTESKESDTTEQLTQHRRT